jgi:hypothetical protein
MAEAQAYAERTGNTNFEECAEEKKPITAEEKASQMAKLTERMVSTYHAPPPCSLPKL